MNIHFILVKTARGEHLGFAARALKTMGFDRLRLVSSQVHDDPLAGKTAYGSHDILRKVGIYQTLDEAIADLDLTIGTTSKQRIKRYDYHHPRELRSILAGKDPHLNNVGVVFGSEENGLTTEELQHCDLISSIPLTAKYPSLNLSQAILIYAWELSGLADSSPVRESPEVPLQRHLRDQASKLLNSLELQEKPLLKRRMMDRLMLADSQDMELILAFLAKLDRSMSNQSSKDP
ncbi:MAG: tRNA/rRNA methyltransferase [Cyclobacteriaceae bacterium]|nr:tRNA/rRNA methyltransferase [Cyclobacteriaceae bacterium]